MGFRDDQLAALRAKLSAKDVQTKVVNGFSLSYVEGWYTIAEANRIFGFDGWDRETLSAECVWQGSLQSIPAAAYVARVRVRVHAGNTEVTRDGSGFGTGTGATQGDAHEKAIKEAETDAMKRALATFGNRFGLALYDKTQSGVTKRRPDPTAKPAAGDSSLPPSGWVLRGADGKIVEIFQDPQAYYGRARKLLGELRDPLAIRELWKNNEEALKALRIAHPELRDSSKTHYTVLFARLCKEQARVAESAVAASGAKARGQTMDTDRAATPPQSQQITSGPAGDPQSRSPTMPPVNGEASDEPHSIPGDEAGFVGEAQISASGAEDQEAPTEFRSGEQSDPASGPPSNGRAHHVIQRAVLPITMPRRIRDKDHLKAVAAQPCLVCGRSPSHAHHLTFVQPRARGLKASDEWAVPLCYLHHRELHDRGDEQAWWEDKQIDPIAAAESFWATRVA